jgi:hypothetical protein
MLLELLACRGDIYFVAENTQTLLSCAAMLEIWILSPRVYVGFKMVAELHIYAGLVKESVSMYAWLVTFFKLK